MQEISQQLSNDFVVSFDRLASIVQQNSADHGFWIEGTKRNQPEMFMLMVSELAEALEGYRKANPPDEHVPSFTSIEIELADCIIRIMDYAHGFGYDVSGAVIAKHNFNISRTMKHGKVC